MIGGTLVSVDRPVDGRTGDRAGRVDHAETEWH